MENALKNQSVFDSTSDFSEPTLRRLPVYLQYLKTLETRNVSVVSCSQIAMDLNLNPIQVRKDIETTGVAGKPKVGYELKELIANIEKFLCCHIKNEAILVGAGHLGYALLGYHGFKEFGLEIVAAFDTSPDKVGKFINTKSVFHTDKLEEIIKRMNIEIGILTVPAAYAQKIADRMVNAGIKAIWNFAPVKINVTDGIIVQHENLASSLAVLSKKIELKINKNI